MAKRINAFSLLASHRENDSGMVLNVVQSEETVPPCGHLVKAQLPFPLKVKMREFQSGLLFGRDRKRVELYTLEANFIGFAS